MPVDPQIQAMLDVLAAMDAPPASQTSPAELRAAYKAMAAADGDPTPVADVVDRTAPGPAGPIPVRVYTPEGDAPFPTLLWFHGGGFVIGDLDTADSAARKLCARSGAVVVSVDYRLAPEHKAPAAVDDCWAATLWVAANPSEIRADPARIAVGGDSAGGNLAALVALRAREAGAPALVHQLLVYPTVDFALTHSSVQENGEGYFLTRDTMEWFMEQYVNGSPFDAKEPLISPLYAESLADLPPATVITAEYDPLRDEGEAYAERLRDAGVAVTTRRYDGMVHGFFQMGTISPVADEAVDLAAGTLRAAF